MSGPWPLGCFRAVRHHEGVRLVLATVFRIGAMIAIVAAGLVVVDVTPAAAAPGWSIVSSPSPAGPTHGELSGVTCTSTTNCLAVGNTAAYAPGGELTLGERWNGSSWSQVPTPDPSWIFGVGPAYLSGIACAGAATCFAVGYEVSGVSGSAGPMIQRWNGSSWSDNAAPGLRSNTSLNAVSCAGASTCHAVGGDGTSLIATRWNGSSWVAVAIRKPPGATRAALSGVKCTSATNCIAVGTYTNATATKTLAERWNGTAWTIVSTPNPTAATSSSFNGIACPNASTCYAVGTYTVARAPRQRTLIERWNGASWSIATSPNPPGAPTLSSVACFGVSSCTAVGTKGASTLIERWNGTAWVIVPSPNPSGALSSALHAVNCPTATACFAVGHGAFASGGDRIFTERWNGVAWNMQASPVKASVSSLHGVACARSTLCFAAGSYEPLGPPTTRALLEQWNGTAWTSLVAPVPNAATVSELAHLACASTRFCVAVGDATVGSQQTLIEQWDGSRWTVVPVAVAGSLAGVACANATDCVAVGTSGGQTLVEQWDGSTWTTAPGAVSGSLNSVSCADATDCMAVGGIDLPNSPVLQWDGETWTPIDGVAPGGILNSGITPIAVSCTAPDDCVLVGDYRNPFFYPLTYAGHWDGSAWSEVTMPTPGFGAFASDLACTSRTDCTAVGSYFPGHGGLLAAIEHWDGTSWAVVTSPNPPTASPPGDSLAGVTCTSASNCFAVGSWISDANTRTLIERFA